MKRPRQTNDRFRWSDRITLKLVEAVFELVKDDPEAFEKPTSQKFYEKIDESDLSKIQWNLMKGKMYHLRKAYLRASTWKRDTGVVLLAEGKEVIVCEYIAKICPHWNLLDKIFGQCLKVNPVVHIDTKPFSHLGDFEKCDLLQNCTSNDTENTIGSFYQTNTPEPMSEPSSSGELSDTNKFFRQGKFKRKQLKSSRFLLYLSEMQKQKLDFEETKLKMTMELDAKKLNLETEKLRNEFEIRKLEIERDERLALAKTKLEMEMQEKIKKYELELQYNNNKI